jgi:type II secretory pathway component PulF
LHAGPWHPAVAVAAALVIATGVPIYNGIRQAERQARQEQEDSQLLEQVHAQLSRMAPASLEPLLELMQEEGKETSQ